MITDFPQRGPFMSNTGGLTTNPKAFGGHWIGTYSITHLANAKRVVQMTPRKWALLKRLQTFARRN